MFGLGSFFAKEVEYWATGGKGYSTPPQSQNNLIHLEEYLQESQPQQSSTVLDCPPLYVGDEYKALLDERLDLFYDCSVDAWNLFCTVMKAVEVIDSHGIASMATARQRGSVPGQKCTLRIPKAAFEMPIADFVFCFAHEVKHGALAHEGKPYGGEREELECDQFAGFVLAQKGLVADYETDHQLAAQISA